MTKKQKLAIGTLIVCIIAVINLKVALDFIQSYDSKVDSIEAISATNDERGYNSESSDCSITEIVDGDGYITIMGKKIKVGETHAGGEYTKTWTNAANKCYKGGEEVSCKAMTCSEFYLLIGE